MTTTLRAPPPGARSVDDAAPPKLRLLGRGLGVVGSYAKVLLVDDRPAAYCQFGPLTAYPRAQRTRDLYPALPDARSRRSSPVSPRRPPPAARAWPVASSTRCATTSPAVGSRGRDVPGGGCPPGRHQCRDPRVLADVGFARAIDDARFPVMRRELT